MKLLIDENLSPRLVQSLEDLFPGSLHVRDCGLRAAADPLVWNFAREHGMTIVSKDDDFHQRSFLVGHPPKVIGLLVGNCPTSRILAILRLHEPLIRQFEGDPDTSYLPLP